MKDPRPDPRLPPPFLGDLSTRDATLLADLATDGRVLEHGAGGSTQIFALVATRVVSIEPVDAWQNTTTGNLRRLRAHGYACAQVTFLTDALHDLPILNTHAPYDLIFVDGPASDRDAFAHVTFPLLAPSGVLVFHDTRVAHEAARALRLATTFPAHVASIEFNPRGSNLTLLRRVPSPVRYSDWNVDEGREEWEAGRAPPPPGWLPYVLARHARVLESAAPTDPNPDPDPDPDPPPWPEPKP